MQRARAYTGSDGARLAPNKGEKKMSAFARSAILSLTLLSGVASIAYAQSENLAALPPEAAVAIPAAPALNATPIAVLGPAPGGLWNPPNSETRSVARPVQSSRYVEPVRTPDQGGDSD
jgi:hypothetical protein